MKNCNNNIYAALYSTQGKKVRVRVLDKGSRSKNKLQSPPQADRHRKPINAVAKRLWRQIGAADEKCSLLEFEQTARNWNVWSLTGKEQELVGNSAALILWEVYRQSAGDL